MNEKQRAALKDLCGRYHTEFDESNFRPQFDLPPGYVAGWISDRIFVGCDPEGRISS